MRYGVIQDAQLKSSMIWLALNIWSLEGRQRRELGVLARIHTRHDHGMVRVGPVGRDAMNGSGRERALTARAALHVM